MTELAFDTHRFVKQLMESGFTEVQAETLADAQMQLLAGRMATKDDIKELQGEIKVLFGEIKVLHNRIDAFAASVDAKLVALRSEFTVLLIRSQIATGAAIITILTFIDYVTG